MPDRRPSVVLERWYGVAIRNSSHYLHPFVERRNDARMGSHLSKLQQDIHTLQN
jgi:hypothetical protein